ncbi:MAG: hypothetical protein Q9180_003243, partial [Flavoplaca navasiana]
MNLLEHIKKEHYQAVKTAPGAAAALCSCTFVAPTFRVTAKPNPKASILMDPEPNLVVLQAASDL